jgi:hypothetical protein
MEFKGTKGKWELKKNEYGYNTSVFTDNSQNPNPFRTICVSRVNDQEQNNANLLLISKSPELLDFIRRISGEMLRNDFVLSEKWYEQAMQLVKESTEIK